MRRALVSWLRLRLKGWSADSDREFHDALFAAQDYDPFSPCHPGHLTIRRFADLCEERLEPCRSVMDLGCGTGEITCELARRHPEKSFRGLDHSAGGIARANANSRRLRLANVAFEVADLERAAPVEADIVLMLDSFHHLVSPGAFLRRWQAVCGRFLLIEPRGDWAGKWRKDLDLDWIVSDLETVRRRLAHTIGEEDPPALVRGAAPPPAHPDSAVEQRYGLADFERFFAPFGLDVRGTVSGIEAFPHGWQGDTATRECFASLAYELYARVDRMLFEKNLDLLAKHWVVYAERGMTGTKRSSPAAIGSSPMPAAPPQPLAVSYLHCSGPDEALCGETLAIPVRIRNDGSLPLSSSCGTGHPDMVSYHWRDRDGATVEFDGLRTPLPLDLEPGGECDVTMRCRAPVLPGRYTLAIDVVREGVTWFSQTGSSPLVRQMAIRAARMA